jgi:multiple sugar transport system substrate-binding protein
MTRLSRVVAVAAACLALGVAAVSLAGCTPAAGASSTGSSSLTNGIGPITFAIGSDDITWLTPVLNAWNASHPGQRVSPLYLPEAANDQLAQLVANLQAKSDAYDVIDLDVVWTAEFASTGWIIPLPASKFPLQEFLPPAVATAMYQGRLYAIPYYSNADLLYYRSDILAKAHQKPPTTWAQLASLATKVAPRYHLDGYAATLAPYEGLTVNFAEAVQSAGGSILSPDGAQVTVDSPQAVTGLDFLVDGLRRGWIPSADLGYEEVSAQQAFESGKFLFLNDWPDVYAAASQPGPGNKVVGKFGVVALPGMNGPGSSSLGGANLAISAYSQHQRTALDFISYLTPACASSSPTCRSSSRPSTPPSRARSAPTTTKPAWSSPARCKRRCGCGRHPSRRCPRWRPSWPRSSSENESSPSPTQGEIPREEECLEDDKARSSYGAAGSASP